MTIEADSVKAFATFKARIEAYDVADDDAGVKLLTGLIGADFKTVPYGRLYSQFCAKLKKAGVNKSEVDTWAKAIRADMDEKSGPRASESGKPIINAELDGFEAAVAAAIAGLREGNEKDPRHPRIYTQKGALVRLRADAGGKDIELVRHGELQNELEHMFEWRNEDDISTECPRAVARHIVTERSFLGLAPELNGIMTTPFFHRHKHEDGRTEIVLVDKEGFDEASGYYLAPHPALNLPPIPDVPTPDDVEKAKWWLLENVVVDFPFDDGGGSSEGSRANWLSMQLQPYLRNVIPGNLPIYTITKPEWGTGANLLIDSTLRIATGHPGAFMEFPDTETELEKRLLGSLAAGDRYVWFSNITRDFISAILAALTTTEEYVGRPLGRTGNVRLPVKFMLVIDGNQIKGAPDMMRRLVPIRMVVKGDADGRTGADFKHAFLDQWIIANWSHLVWACLVLIKHWAVSGARLGPYSMASFDGWAGTMGGILDSIGVKGFLSNRSIFMQEDADDDEEAFRAFVKAWAIKYGIGRKAARVVGNPDTDHDSLIRLMEEDDDIDIEAKGEDGKAKTKWFGRHFIRTYKDRTVKLRLGKGRGGTVYVTIRTEHCTKAGAKVYWLERVNVGVSLIRLDMETGQWTAETGVSARRAQRPGAWS